MAKNDLLYLIPKGEKDQEIDREMLNTTFNDPLEELLNEFSDIIDFEDEDDDEHDQEISNDLSGVLGEIEKENLYEKLELLKQLQKKTKFLLREVNIYS